MHRKNQIQKTSIKLNESYQGETIEHKINRIVNNKEPITDGAPLIYTDRKDGVKPETDIRTDRFEIAVDAMDKVTKSHLAKRQAKIDANDPEKIKAKENMEKEKAQEKINGKPSTGDTENKK